MLIIAEKSTVAQAFATALGAEKQKGFFQAGNTTITYCVGHLYELSEPDDYDDKSIEPTKAFGLPIIPKEFVYKAKPETLAQTRIVTNIIKKHLTDEIVVATDADREGEVIARIVLREAGLKDYSRCKRFWVSEALTKEVVLTGLKNIKPLSEYNALAAKGFARQHADWLVGMNLSRYVSDGNTSLFSVGRVQTAILAAIAKRNNDIKNFKPETYYECEVSVSDSAGNKVKAALLNPQTNKTDFPQKNEWLIRACAFFNRPQQLVAQSRIIRRTEQPPKLLSLTELSKLAADEFDYSAAKTLELAQSLYEKHACLSYPRTSGTVMGDDNVALFREKYELLAPLYAISKYCNPANISEDNKHIFNSKKLDSESHHALIPLAPCPEGASQDEKNVFGIVVKIFFQSCMDAFVYDEKQIIFTNNEYKMKSAIKKIVQSGWKASEGKRQEEEYVAAFDERNCTSISAEVREKQTQPKKQFTESTLLAFMKNPTNADENEETKLVGLGTEATRGTIIKKLFDKEYVVKERRAFFATQKGVYLLNALMRSTELSQIVSIAQTTKWEKYLDENPSAFEQSIKNYVNVCIQQEKPFQKFEGITFGECPLCKGKIAIGKWGYYCKNYKDGCKFSLGKTICKTVITTTDVQTLIDGKITRKKSFTGKSGKKFDAKLQLQIKEGKCKLNFIFDKTRKTNKKKGENQG